jgi:hypothetical protein
MVERRRVYLSPENSFANTSLPRQEPLASFTPTTCIFNQRGSSESLSLVESDDVLVIEWSRGPFIDSDWLLDLLPHREC